MEYNHTEKIVETYQKILKLTSDSSIPNKEILDIILNVYTFAYEAGEHEEMERVHYYYRDLINEETMLKKCHRGQ